MAVKFQPSGDPDGHVRFVATVSESNDEVPRRPMLSASDMTNLTVNPRRKRMPVGVQRSRNTFIVKG